MCVRVRVGAHVEWGVGARVTGSGGGTRVEVVVGEVGLSSGRTGGKPGTRG